MTIKVVHLSLTPLAGSPIRIVKALNAHTSTQARLIVLDPGAYGARVFDNDLTWAQDQDESRQLLKDADIVHFHHYFEIDDNPFGVDFRDVCSPRTCFLRQFHSVPMTIARGDRALAQRIVDSKIPQLVISQYPERYFPRARVVPNIVPINDQNYLPTTKTSRARPRVFFAPSRLEPAWSVVPGQTRWDTKGAPETEQVLISVIDKCDLGDLSVRHNIPHTDCLKERQQSDIVVDEMITGSFHLSSLEALAQGLPTFAYLDPRTIETLTEVTEARNLPWLNFRLEEMAMPLTELLRDEKLRNEIGEASRGWMEQYYSDELLVRHYLKAYKDLLEKPDMFERTRIDINNRAQVFMSQRRFDLVWQARADSVALSEQCAASQTVPAFEDLEVGRRGIPDWIKAPVHKVLRKYTSVRVDEIQRLEIELANAIQTLEFVSAHETNGWLYRNRLERMDATVPMFDASRREFHLDRYRFAAKYVNGKTVLDCASGTGYGVQLLVEQGAARGIGIELDCSAVKYALNKHALTGAMFICASGDRMPLPTACVDVITSFETIEHVPDDEKLVSEFYRVLKPCGLLIISTPNQWPLADTPFHVREYDRRSFIAVLNKHFECLEFYNQNSGSPSPFNRGQARGIIPTTEKNEQVAECYLAVCRRR